MTPREWIVTVLDTRERTFYNGAMPIDVTQLIPQLRQLTDRTATIHQRRVQQVAQMQRVFSPEFDIQAWDELCTAASHLSGVRWIGALVNSGEPINQFHAFGQEPANYVLIATDGSQIMPDRHKPVQYAALQVACSCIVYGHATHAELLTQVLRASGHKPLTLMGEDKLFDESTGEYISPGQISTERDLQEIELLAEQCERFRTTGLQPIAVADGSLVPFSLLNEVILRANPKEADEQFRRIVHALNRMRDSGAIVAGYIDRPNSNALARSCALADAPAGVAHDEKQLREILHRAEQAMFGIVDRHLLVGLLPAMQRTALFEPTWLVNTSGYLGKFGHTMRCCYMNIAKDGSRPEIARLEMPAWCSGSQAIGTVSAVMGRHARMGGNYPLCLKAAHEEAVITHRDEEEIDQIIERSLAEQGILTTPSAKQGAKERH